MRQRFWLRAMGLGLAVAGCGQGDVERTAELSHAVELGQRGVIYDVAFAAAPSLAALATTRPELTDEARARVFERELSVQALPLWSSGSITIPALTGVGGAVVMAPSPAQSRIRYSCGATLISPSFAITAGHCPTADTKLDELRLQMYRPTAELQTTWSKATVVSGTFPLLSHPQLGEADGYFIDQYDCVVRTRCYSDDVACQNPGSDVALLECEGRPGDKYGYLGFGAASAGAEALVHWKHEVLDVHEVDGSVPPDLEQHYVQYDGPSAQNFHYFESGNQLLPLRSIPWPDGSPNTFISESVVDVHGCHGTSGSGVLVRVEGSAEFRLVGPVATGGPSFGNRLCQQVPNPDGAESGPGRHGMGVNLAAPAVLLSQYAAELAEDCEQRGTIARDTSELPFAAGSYQTHTLFGFLPCALHGFALAGTVTADAVFGAYRDRLVDDEPAPERTVAAFDLEADADYRVALHAQSLGACPGCPAPTLRVGASVVTPPVEPIAGRSVLAHLFAAPAAGPIELGITHAGSGLAVGGLTLVREGQVSTFDAVEERLAASLYALDAAGEVRVGPVPGRFAGDGRVGYLARLERGERLAFTRQALAAQRRWTVRLGATGYDGLSCGLLGLDGDPVISTSCGEVFQLDDRAGVGARLAFFVELPLSSEREQADISYFALASDLARDPDGDQVPDVLDNCPGDWNAAQAECSEEPPVPGGEGGAGGAAEAGAGGEASGSGGEEAGGGAGTDAGEAGTSGAGTSAGGSSAAGGASGGSSAQTGGGASGAAPSLGGDGGPAGTSTGDSGCGCRLSGGRQGAHGWLLLALLGGLLRRRRRFQAGA